MKRRYFLFGISIIYSFTLFFFLTLWRLPPGIITDWMLPQFTGGKIAIQGKELSIGPAFTIKIQEPRLGIRLKNGFIFEKFDYMKIWIDWKRLFLGYYPLGFYFRDGNGEVKGKVGLSFSKGLKGAYFDIQTRGVSINSIEILKIFLKREISGLFSGIFDIKGDLLNPENIQGRGGFVIEKGAIQTRIDIPGISRIPFREMRVSFKLKDGTVNLEKGMISGEIFSGEVTGLIKLKHSIYRSLLNINARLRPGQGFKRLMGEGGFISKIMRNGQQLINVIIRGTILRPDIRILKG